MMIHSIQKVGQNKQSEQLHDVNGMPIEAFLQLRHFRPLSFLPYSRVFATQAFLATRLVKGLVQKAGRSHSGSVMNTRDNIG